MIAKIITVVNHKGGVGKTTTSINVGAGLARRKKKILLVDLDPQASLSHSLGIHEPEIPMYRIIKTGMHIGPDVPVKHIQRLEVVPSSLDLSGLEVDLPRINNWERTVEKLLLPIRGRYDYIIIDSPPSLGHLTINALTASDMLLIPVQPEYLGLQGLGKLMEIVDKVRGKFNHRIDLLGVVVTMYDKRKILHRDMVTMIKRSFPGGVFSTMIRDNIALAEAPAMGKDIFSYDPRSHGALDYEALCKEILARDKQ